uniref:DNA replication licensing factor MCM5 n=1 Tax=Globodera rostochiensis TaxID=31243 RepID=A0A914HME9_GLORO
MSNLDNPGIFYQDRVFSNDAADNVLDGARELVAEYKRLDDIYQRFIREFSIGGLSFKYREDLKLNYTLGNYSLSVDFNDLATFDEDAAGKIKRYPTTFLPALESAVKKVVDDITHPRPPGDEEVHDVQVIVNLSDKALGIRKVKSSDVSQLVKVSGIVVSASQVRSRATKVTLQCRTCRHTIADREIRAGLEGFQLPRQCQSANQQAAVGGQRCPFDPYMVLPDKCRCIDFQTLKLQELPEDVPHSEMPRHLQIYVDRYLTDKVSPGNRITVTGIYSIKRITGGKKSGKDDAKAGMSGIRTPYIRAVGIQVQMTGLGRADQMHFTPEEERQFKELAKDPHVHDILTRSIAPSIFGSDDIKRVIACLLFGGSRKRLPDELTRRGDINVLLLGDPGTAKSQLLKFVERVAPVAVYTSGKGSSAAGLTAAIIRDPHSRSFIMEGGAMVLADGGVVCIDEFDKMREDDRAGITTTLNSRCSVLAAANSVFGRWDDSRGDENIDFMPTILSRFDCIFVVKDHHDGAKDLQLAKHVISVHVRAMDPQAQILAVDGEGTASQTPHSQPMAPNGELSLEFLKRFIAYARANCAPRISESASNKLINQYVQMRNMPTDHQQKRSKKHPHAAIPITVRQLEAVVRLSESLAKMELAPFAQERHVDEALRLFKVSTIAAAQSGNLSGVEGFTSTEDQEAFNRVEKQLKKRFQVGTYASEQLIIEEFARQGYPEGLVRKAIEFYVRRGDLQYRMQRKLLYRLK